MINKSMSVRLHFSVSISRAESPKTPVPLGMESGAIFDSQITASSMSNDRHAAPNARLYFKGSENPVRHGGWVAREKNINQWLQVDLQHIIRVIGIATQGKPASKQWVTKYKLQYGDDGQTFRVYKRDGDVSDTVWKNMLNWTNLFAEKKSPWGAEPFCILHSDPFPLSHKAVTLGWAIYSLSLNLQKSIHESYRLRVTRTVKKKNLRSLILRPNIFYSGFPRKQEQRHSSLPRS